MVKGANAEIARLDGFLAKFPTGLHAGEARKLRSEMLQVAVMLSSKERAKELSQASAESANDKSLSVDERVEARLTQLRAESVKIASKPARTKAWADGLIAIQKDSPKSDAIYRAMMSFLLTAEGEDAKRVARVVAASPDARPAFREQAREILGAKAPGA